MAPPPPKSAELLSKHKHGWKGFEGTFTFNDQQTGVASFQITSNKTWRSCRLIQVWLHIRTYLHSYKMCTSKMQICWVNCCSPSSHTWLYSLTHTSVGYFVRVGKWLKFWLLNSVWPTAAPTQPNSRQTFQRWQTLAVQPYSFSGGMWTKGFNTICSHCFFYLLTGLPMSIFSFLL